MRESPNYFWISKTVDYIEYIPWYTLIYMKLHMMKCVRPLLLVLMGIDKFKKKINALGE